jgi:hypothetical protein
MTEMIDSTTWAIRAALACIALAVCWTVYLKIVGLGAIQKLGYWFRLALVAVGVVLGIYSVALAAVLFFGDWPESMAEAVCATFCVLAYVGFEKGEQSRNVITDEQKGGAEGSGSSGGCCTA